jgi:hypothetical protein
MAFGLSHHQHQMKSFPLRVFFPFLLIPCVAKFIWSPCHLNSNNNNFVKLLKFEIIPSDLRVGTKTIINYAGYSEKFFHQQLYVSLQIKHSFLNILIPDIDFCGSPGEGEDMGKYSFCDIRKGRFYGQKEIFIPDETFPGKYELKIRIYDNNGEDFYCLKSEVDILE